MYCEIGKYTYWIDKNGYVSKNNPDGYEVSKYLYIIFPKEEKEDTKSYRKSEFRYGEFSRTVYFPADIDIDKTDAHLEHGILKIVAPKLEKESDKVKKLAI